MTNKHKISVQNILDTGIDVKYLRSIPFKVECTTSLGDSLIRYHDRWEVIDRENNKLIITEEPEKVVGAVTGRISSQPIKGAQIKYEPTLLYKTLLVCPVEGCGVSQPARSVRSSFRCGSCSQLSKPFWQEHLGWHLVQVS